MSSLYVMRGRDQGRRFELQGDVVSIGRESGNTIRLRDTEVSRRHGELRRTSAGQWALVDLQSSNGTFIEQQRIENHALRSGDRIRIGKTWMLFTQAEEQTSPPIPQVDIVSTNEAVEMSQIVARSDRSVVSRRVDELAREDRTAIGDLAIMLRAAQAASHTLDIAQLCDRLLELIFEAIHADRGCIMLTDPDSGDLSPRAVRTRNASPDRLQISQSILDYVMTQGEGVLTSDARDDERWETGASILRQGIREAICVPMQGRYGVVGVIYVDTKVRATESIEARKQRRFRDDQLHLMVAIGQQAALAVEDTSFYSALVQSERLAAIGQTVATLSHHIKNILQGLRGGGFLIQEGIKQKDDEAVEKGWRMVERNQDRIQHLVLDMLTFSKERSPDLSTGQLNETVQEVVELMQRAAVDAGIGLTTRFDTNLPAIRFDSEGIHRAVLNLVTNAIDTCSSVEAGRIQVSTEWDPGESRAIVVVSDNGEGIPPEDLERIFRPFESTKGNRGTGLGLPATRKIAREHGGDVEVSSTVGSGSEFRLWLPGPCEPLEDLSDELPQHPTLHG
ncbi:MAG: FHA domain-containing protein [Planctomycetales bacterium]|nr:FHA domain-containing protein [Planctomycetales bacterium]